MSFDAILAVNAVFAQWGVAALYWPPGARAGVACTVLENREDVPINFGDTRALAPGRILEVRSAEIARPERDGVFHLGAIVDGAFVEAERVRVLSQPKTLDQERLVFSFTVAPIEVALPRSTFPTPPASYVPSLNFSDARNSGYLSLFEDI